MHIQNKFSGLLRYNQKVFRVANLIQEFDEVRPFKQTNDAQTMFGIYSGLVSGKTSLNALATHADCSRSILEDFLNLRGLASRLRKFIKSMLKRMKRGKMIDLQHVQGKYLASVDGVETFRRNYRPEDFYAAVRAGQIDVHCQVAVHENAKTGLVEGYEVYHRIVIVCMITERGPFPIAWGYQQSTAGLVYKLWLESGAPTEKAHPRKSEGKEKAKQEGELTVFKQLLLEIKAGNGGKLPFDIIVGDGLYDKAPVLEAVEKSGAVLIAVQKDARRIVRSEAEEDFNTRPPSRTWEEVKRHFEGWSGTYQDEHLLRGDKNIKIVRVKRRNRDGYVIDNYFYCSAKSWITPRLVEWCRHYRWKEENGFNAWTNQWHLLKHVFHHTAAACDAMLGLIFMAIIGAVNYRFGNLRRRTKKKHQTFKEFIHAIACGYTELKKKLSNHLKDFLKLISSA